MSWRDGLTVAIGGGVGGSIRFALTSLSPDPAGNFPTTILAINLAGAFALGWLLRFLLLSGPDEGWTRRARLGIGTGMIGGFTTYSTFIVQAMALIQTGHLVASIGYMAISLVGGMLLVWLGMQLATRMAGHTGKQAPQ